MAIIKNKASQGLYVYAHDTAADAAKTGDAANITATISLGGAAAGATNDVNPTEIGGGVYWFTLTQAETNAGALALVPVSATGDVVLDPVIVLTQEAVITYQSGDAYARLGAPAGASVSADIADIPTVTEFNARSLAAADYTVVSDLGTVQTGDAYAVVNHADYGNAKLVRSTTPANTLDVSVTGEAGLDFANIKDATGAHTLTNITVPAVTTVGSVTNGVTLADDAITAAKFDESTAFPLKSADTGATAVARTGADSDTLETLSDQLDDLPTNSELGTALSGLNDITVADIIAGIADGPFNLRDILRILLAVTAGKATGGKTTEISFRDPTDTVNRVILTVDQLGNRSAVDIDTDDQIIPN